MNMRLIVPALILPVIIASCKKADLPDPGIAINENNIEIATPFEQQIFKHGDTIFMNASIHAKTELHGYTISLAKSNGDVIHSYTEHTHGTEIHMSEYWVNTLTGTNDIILSISANVDHEGTELSNSVNFKTE